MVALLAISMQELATISLVLILEISWKALPILKLKINVLKRDNTIERNLVSFLWECSTNAAQSRGQVQITAKWQLLIIYSTETLRTVVNEVKGKEKDQAGLKAACVWQRPFSGVNWAGDDVLVVAGVGLT